MKNNNSSDVGGLIFFLVLIGVFLWWDFPNPFSDKINSYIYKCSEPFENGMCKSNNFSLKTHTYRISPIKNEVVLFSHSKINSPLTLSSCSVFDKNNWECLTKAKPPFKKFLFVDGAQKSPAGGDGSKFQIISQYKYRFLQSILFFKQRKK